MSATPDSRLLRRALLGNALFSTVCGLILLLGASPLDPWLGIPAWVLRAVGLGLLPFALGLFLNARREVVRRSEAWVAVALDLAWVAGSAWLVLGELWPLREPGTWAVIGVAAVVLECAVFQALGLVRSAPKWVREAA